MTKPLGTGILTTVLKNKKLNDEFLKQVSMVMKRWNKNATEIMQKY